MLINRDRYAYDLSKNIVSTGEIWDDKVINQSIEMIISTMYGERVFNPMFGSPLNSFLFEGVSRKTAEAALNGIVTAVKRWEKRISIIEDGLKMVVSKDGHSIVLKIPYIINKSQIVSMFDKKIMF